MSGRLAVVLEPAWVLHRYPYRETSLIVEVLTRAHGRVGVVARGARRGRRDAAPLAPFAPLHLGFRRGGELATLTGCESAGAAYAFRGAAFLAGCYLNELVLRLLPRDDAAPEVYALYGEALERLAPDPAVAVRRFEGRLLRALGWIPRTDRDGSGAPLAPDRRYRYDPERGPVAVPPPGGLSAAMLAAVAAERFEEAPVRAAAGEIFRGLIAYHLGGRELKSLKVARAMHRVPTAGERA